MAETLEDFEQVLCGYGWSADKIREDVKHLVTSDEVTILLAGSIVDGLQNEESDVDTLFVSPELQLSDTTMEQEGVQVKTFGLNHGRLQVEYSSSEIIQELVDKIDITLRSDGNELALLSVPERRILHRIVTGIPIHNPDRANELKKIVDKARLATYTVISNAYEAESSLRDATGEIEAKNFASAVRMLQMGAEFLCLSVLGMAGETNQNRKWSYRLIRRNENIEASLKAEIIRPFFPRWKDGDAAEYVHQLYRSQQSILDHVRFEYSRFFTEKGIAGRP